MIITLKNQLCLLAFRACFIQKKFFVEMLILSKLLPPFWQKIRASSRKCNFLGFQTSCCANGQAKLGLLRELLSLVQHYSDGGSVGGTVFPPLDPTFALQQ